MKRPLRQAEVTALQDPALAVLLGSGLGTVAEGFPSEAVMPFEAIPGVSRAGVEGHRGELRWGRVGERLCLFICGRKHYYEGGSLQLGKLVEFLNQLRVRKLLVTSAAGSLSSKVRPGELLVVDGIIDLQFRQGSLQKGLTRVGGVQAGRPSTQRLLELDQAMRRDLVSAAASTGVPLAVGSLVSCAGPAYETPGEVRALQYSDASVVSMSGAPEIAMAQSFGIQVASIALVTNWASGISQKPLCHDEVLASGRDSIEALRRLVIQLVDMI